MFASNAAASSSTSAFRTFAPVCAMPSPHSLGPRGRPTLASHGSSSSSASLSSLGSGLFSHKMSSKTSSSPPSSPVVAAPVALPPASLTSPSPRHPATVGKPSKRELKARALKQERRRAGV